MYRLGFKLARAELSLVCQICGPTWPMQKFGLAPQSIVWLVNELTSQIVDWRVESGFCLSWADAQTWKTKLGLAETRLAIAAIVTPEPGPVLRIGGIVIPSTKAQFLDGKHLELDLWDGWE
ncbi:hypothetical protein ACH5RR_017554 [Cinchona calisaya]|uniref:Uncharacterized protein n=1 Tax=Cinchona calisaya TaxID=153742 RepID=A0ABD2ZMH6_9GENT